MKRRLLLDVLDKTRDHHFTSSVAQLFFRSDINQTFRIFIFMLLSKQKVITALVINNLGYFHMLEVKESD